MTVAMIGLLWGLNWPAVKFMLTELPPVTIRAVALTVAALVMGVIVRARGETLVPARGETGPVVVAGLLTVFGFNVATTFGQMLTETARAAIIAYTMPAMTAALAALVLGERLGPRGLLALAIGMGGLGVLASEDIAALVASSAGPAIMLLAAFSWACGTVALKARVWSLTPLALSVWFFAVSAAACWPLVLVFEPPWAQTWPSVPVLATLAYHALGPMVVCYALWTDLVGRIPASVAALATLIVPVVGVSSSILLLGDPLTWQKALALAMVLASIALVQAPVRPAPNRE
jgi:drug/metabolite transporter (DMT)-like permease